MANRPKLTIEDQVAYMKNKGITFDHCSEKDAVRFLQESTVALQKNKKQIENRTEK